MAGWLLLAAAAQAATVNFLQTSVNDVDGATIGAVSSSQFLETGTAYSTLTAPSTFSTYRFTHWTNSSYPAVSYRDGWGRSLNPGSLVVLEAVTATAHYLPATRDMRCWRLMPAAGPSCNQLCQLRRRAATSASAAAFALCAASNRMTTTYCL